ncbi:MAG: M14 metallopeptidase family protein [Bryobacteraceae bacterium]
MARRLSILIALLVCLLAAAPPTPREHFGFTPGEDYKLADYGQIAGYFEKLARSSDRIRWVEFGRTSLGKPMYAAFISSAENLRKLEHYREISRKLALGEASPEEARRLAVEGKAIVWIDSGLHATEVAPAQHAPELAWRMVTDESEETRRIRENVILLQVPVINPDGLDMVAQWYRRNVGTPYELAPLPWLYQKYAGHDNNRDFFMMNLTETRNVARMLFDKWLPQIVYNQHQQPAFPARIFVPPYAEPLNPHIPAAVMEGINGIGSAMAERFALENKPGVISYSSFDGWWNGGLRSVPAFHNMHGILTETALYSYATPHVYTPNEFPERFSGGIPSKAPTIFYQRPWMGGKWGVRDAIEYMLTADFAILDLAANRPSRFLMKAYELARASIEAGKKGSPYAYVVPAEQWDRSNAIEMLRRLQMGGIRVHRAKSEFTAGGKRYDAGSYVLAAAQPFRPFLMDLMEAQKFPELRSGANGPVRRPYDIAGWTLPVLMGVKVDRIDAPFDADLEAMSEIPPVTPAFVEAAKKLPRPRVALYEPWTANINTGWTEWVLDAHQVPYTKLHNEDIRKGGLRERFDTIILASQSAASILHGSRDGENSRGSVEAWVPRALQRPEYTGGIGLPGLANLDDFVRAGGTLVAVDNAAALIIDNFGLPVRNVVTGAASYSVPGSLLRVKVDNQQPLAAGMPPEVAAFVQGGQAFEITLLDQFNKGDREVRSVARYAESHLLASGWLTGENTIAGRHAVVQAQHGAGRVVLFGFRPDFRGQSFGTFRLLLNAIYLGPRVR